MGVGEDRYESFATAVEDPYFGALLGTIDEPGGTSTANLAGRVTRDWWDLHGTGPTCMELIGAVFEVDDRDDTIRDPGRTLLERREQLDLLHRWLISYWSRFGTISFIPGHDDIVRPGRIDPAALSGTDGTE
ncbi:hypothetical protein [Microbacterium lacticum]|uniref:hypothetical protein n=1 Tax=Microbacterium lacticum TaxID=33885 RepID=UPI001F569AC4|nr:hypothetical protein [Microbacterium lacticum]